MVHPSAILGTVFSFALSVGASPTAYNSNRVNKLAVQGHRGGLGYRPESKCSTFTAREIEASNISSADSGTLWAFANALELGVNALEMDTVFTKDGIVNPHRLSQSILILAARVIQLTLFDDSPSFGMITKFWQQSARTQFQVLSTLER